MDNCVIYVHFKNKYIVSFGLMQQISCDVTHCSLQFSCI
jgi:hypothetical protein